jgi:hypothetical protein
MRNPPSVFEVEKHPNPPHYTSTTLKPPLLLSTIDK